LQTLAFVKEAKSLVENGKTMTNTRKKWFIRAALLLLICAMALLAIKRFAINKKDEGLAKGNGRIEAVEIDIAAKLPGPVKDFPVKEGDFVTAGQILAHMDTQVLYASGDQQSLRAAGCETHHYKRVRGNELL
jgi:HlyD family secretion protein